MDTKIESNTCRILRRREIQKNSVPCYKLISDKLNRNTKLLYQRDLIAHYGCVNAVEFSNDGRFLVSGGDDRRVLLWNVQKALHSCQKPTVMCSEHHSNIFCLSFDNSVSHIYSGGNDNQVILHDIETGKAMDVFNLEHPVFGISVDPCNDKIFSSAGEDGRILIFDIRLHPSNDPYLLASSKSAFHAVNFNPVDPRLITTANSKEGAALWDIRVAGKILLQYGRKHSCMNVRWDQTGTKILALRRRRTPVLYEYNQPKHIAQFFHENYYNSCTMKSCCFAGLKDEFVLSGSDDFNLYMWKISDAMNSVDRTNNALVLKGHRSIVNQVRFDPYNCVIASSGVEKLIKIWSPLPLPHSTQNSNSWFRIRYTHHEYSLLALASEPLMSHDYSEQSTSEDPQMIAFFDSLLQRERERPASDSDDSSDEQSLCTSIESLEDTDYSSLSEDSPVPSNRNSVPTVPPRDHDNESSVPRSRGSASANRNSSTSADDELGGLPGKTYENLAGQSSSSNASLAPISSASSTSSPSSSSSSSSNSEEEQLENVRNPKRKLKSKVKDALQRLKRVRSAAQSSSTTPADSASERSTVETYASSGGTSTDTVDSGVYMYSSPPPPPKFKFTSFKRSEKRKYRSRKSSSSSMSSSDSD